MSPDHPGLSDFDKSRIEDILIDRFGDWFSAHLLRLIAISDPLNTERLRSIYPEHVKAVEDYRKGIRGDKSQ